MAVSRARTRQWSRIALSLAALFASLPIAGRIVLGRWEFEEAAGLAGLCFIAGAYAFLLSRRHAPVPDPAAVLEQAMELAAAGRARRAIAALTGAIRTSPRLWQAYQYRGELLLAQPEDGESALADFEEAIRLAPDEPHLYKLREQARLLVAERARGIHAGGAEGGQPAGEDRHQAQD
ncbi:MAG TPA: hypothetical protein VGF59_13515 [Bryobacteraceae bacterium]|jgi:tetratricopeptide (TPR) repeat protein